MTLVMYFLGFVVMLAYADGVMQRSPSLGYMYTGFPVLMHCIGVGAIVVLKVFVKKLRETLHRAAAAADIKRNTAPHRRRRRHSVDVSFKIRCGLFSLPAWPAPGTRLSANPERSAPCPIPLSPASAPLPSLPRPLALLRLCASCVLMLPTRKGYVRAERRRGLP